MAEALGRVKGGYAGLQSYLKTVLSELNECVNADGCEQEKILGFKLRWPSLSSNAVLFTVKFVFD